MRLWWRIDFRPICLQILLQTNVFVTQKWATQLHIWLTDICPPPNFRCCYDFQFLGYRIDVYGPSGVGLAFRFWFLWEIGNWSTTCCCQCGIAWHFSSTFQLLIISFLSVRAVAINIWIAQWIFELRGDFFLNRTSFSWSRKQSQSRSRYEISENMCILS